MLSVTGSLGPRERTSLQHGCLEHGSGKQETGLGLVCGAPLLYRDAQGPICSLTDDYWVPNMSWHPSQYWGYSRNGAWGCSHSMGEDRKQNIQQRYMYKRYTSGGNTRPGRTGWAKLPQRVDREESSILHTMGRKASVRKPPESPTEVRDSVDIGETAL